VYCPGSRFTLGGGGVKLPSNSMNSGSENAPDSLVPGPSCVLRPTSRNPSPQPSWPSDANGDDSDGVGGSGGFLKGLLHQTIEPILNLKTVLRRYCHWLQY
jgi:hypothetical protein